MPRRFSRRQRSALYIESGGRCALCGQELDAGWHADHIIPFSKGGKTVIGNGQALCSECNLRKGDKDVEEIKLRPFQEEFISVVMHKAETLTSDDKTIVADVHPGSGKTLACLAAADLLFQHGYIDAVAVFVPRVNLAIQFEQDWAEAKNSLPWRTTMGPIYRSDNNPPLFYRGASGYVTTYNSLVSRPALHAHEIASKRTLVIFDEAQQLGANYSGSEPIAVTESARWAEEIGDVAQMIFVLSGTPFRADDSRLLFAEYSDPDEYGFMELQPDVSATYRDGVREKYLRPFEAIMHDGKALWQKFGEETQEITLSTLSKSAYRVITQPGYWQPLADRFVRHLEEQKEQIHSKLCGLVAANNQAQARKIKAYLDKKYPHLKSLIAVSDDGSEAHSALREFREGNHDILVTVSMAYVGYDHKPITSVLVLTSIRSEGYLRQLLARALRMWSKVQPENQVCYVFVPDDLAMREFVDKLRDESRQGAIEQEVFLSGGSNGGDGNLGQQEMGYALDAWLTKIRARGIDPSGDLTPEEYAEAERIRQEMGIPYPVTILMAFHREWTKRMSPDSQQLAHKSGGQFLTYQEKFEKAKSHCHKEAGRTDSALKMPFGTTNRKLWGAFGHSIDGCKSIEEVHERTKLAIRWREQVTMTDRVVRFGDNDWRNMLITELKRTGGDPSHLFEILETVIEQRAWEHLRDESGESVGSLRRLIEAPPPVGCGQPAEKVLKLLEVEHRYEHDNADWRERMRKLREAISVELDTEIQLGTHGGDRRSEDAISSLHVNLKLAGNSREYAMAKLKSERPDLYEKVLSGKIRSANAAAIQAGFRNPSMTVFLDDMKKNAKKLAHYLEDNQILELIEYLYDELDTSDSELKD